MQAAVERGFVKAQIITDAFRTPQLDSSSHAAAGCGDDHESRCAHADVLQGRAAATQALAESAQVHAPQLDQLCLLQGHSTAVSASAACR